MTTITWPSAQITSIEEAIRSAIADTVTINFKVTGSGCYNCSLDPITNTSTNPYCDICFGTYWINTSSGYTTKGHVRWTRGEIPAQFPGGKLPEGDCLVTFTLASGLQYIVENSDSFIINSKKLTLKSYTLKGKPQPNRLKVTLTQEGS